MRTSEASQHIFWKYATGRMTYEELKEETAKLADKQVRLDFKKGGVNDKKNQE